MLSGRRKRPSITSPCYADRYTRGPERIAEFSNGAEGGLISLRTLDDGTLRVEVYACSERVVVVAPRKDVERLHAADAQGSAQ